MRALCRRLVEEVATVGECDFVSEFALRFPTEAFLSMTGVDPTDADLFVPWVEDFFRGFGGDSDGLAAMAAALDGIREYWVAALDERRGEALPREGDLASHLLHSTFDERPLSDAEMLDMLTVLVLAGLDTTRATLGYLFRHLAARPDHRRRLIDEPELIPSAVEEALRFYTIIFGDGRKVTRDTEFHGVQLKQGDMVYALVSGANRDPRAYERADEFVIDRRRNQHMGFANGPHRCLGAHLARRELAVMFQKLFQRLPDIQAVEPPQLLDPVSMPLVTGVKHLRVQFTPGGGGKAL
jgi:cytochrome P450